MQDHGSANQHRRIDEAQFVKIIRAKNNWLLVPSVNPLVWEVGILVIILSYSSIKA